VRARQPRIGVRKLYHLLKAEFEKLDCNLGRDALFGLLRDHGLLIKSPKRGRRTTFANHRFHRYPNRIANLTVHRVHQVFVADITYLDTLEGFVYLALITDLFSRKIVGFDVSDSLSVEGALRALKIALKPVTRADALIHHSDRGIQYCCHAYTDLLGSGDVKISMTENGDVYQNAVAERVNGILKIDFLLNQTFVSMQHAKASVKQSICIYNNERPHLSLAKQTPQTVYQKSLERRQNVSLNY
jgi:transposase InsO family protein